MMAATGALVVVASDVVVYLSEQKPYARVP